MKQSAGVAGLVDIVVSNLMTLLPTIIGPTVVQAVGPAVASAMQQYSDIVGNVQLQEVQGSIREETCVQAGLLGVGTHEEQLEEVDLPSLVLGEPCEGIGMSGSGAALEALEVGTQVVISGLSSALELNGEIGYVLGLEASSGRYRIEVANYGCKRIERENLAIDDGLDEDDYDEIVNGVSGRAGHDVKYCTGYHVASACH